MRASSCGFVRVGGTWLAAADKESVGVRTRGDGGFSWMCYDPGAVRRMIASDEDWAVWEVMRL